MKKAIIVGATGYGGLGLIEILRRHPGIEIKQLIARKEVGLPIDSVFPHLKGFIDMQIQAADNIDFSGLDIAFFSTPDRAGMSLIRNFYERNIPVIDFSGDFRFKTPEEYSSYAAFKGMETNHLASDILKHSVYGLPEIYSESIRNAAIIGNPGCFAICMILGLLPAVDAGIIESDTIICDGKTGVSGAGKNPGEANFFPQRHENINSYREGKHQHLIEVENILNSRKKNPVKLLFVPQIIPMNRGILVTSYAQVKENINTKKILGIFRDYYKNKPFIVITEKSPGTAEVKGTNRCLIKPVIDERTGKLFIISAIDNLMKGQSGNAVQNANILLGFDERTGLDVPAFYP